MRSENYSNWSTGPWLVAVFGSAYLKSVPKLRRPYPARLRKFFTNHSQESQLQLPQSTWSLNTWAWWDESLPLMESFNNGIRYKVDYIHNSHGQGCSILIKTTYPSPMNPNHSRMGWIRCGMTAQIAPAQPMRDEKLCGLCHCGSNFCLMRQEYGNTMHTINDISKKGENRLATKRLLLAKTNGIVF